METLSGRAAKASDFKGTEWIADLIYFDGPLLTLFSGERGSDILALWVDCDSRRNRWLSFAVSRSKLSEYLNGSATLRQLVQEQNEALFFHTTNGVRKNSLRWVAREDIPQAYLPDENSYWHAGLATEDGLTLANEHVKAYRIGLDGENWYVDDFSKALGCYRQLYAFHYAMHNRFRTSVRAAASKALSKLAWRGGASTVMWFNALHAVTPAMHRLRVKELRYASPGYITLEVLPSVATDVAVSIAALQEDSVRDVILELYSETYAFFRQHGLTSLDARDMSEITPAKRKRMESEGVFDGITHRLDAFLSAYKFRFAKADLLAAGAEELGLLKAILSYHRRAVRLVEYVEEGGMSIDLP